MALQSRLFRGDAQIEAAAVSDPAHVVPGARGPHVAKIQRALNILDGAALAEDGTYGARTAGAVSAFKQKRNILNAQGQIDNITGKKTVAALDTEMLARERGGGGLQLNFGLDDDGTGFRVVPFRETNPFLISQQKDNRGKGDLTSTPAASISHLPFGAVTKIVAARNTSTFLLESEFLLELSTGAGTLGTEMGKTFINNAAVQEVPFKDGSALSIEVRSSSAFLTAHADVTAAITKQFKSTIASRNEVDFHDLAAAKGVITPPVFGFQLLNAPALKFAIGSFQGVDLFLVKFEATNSPRRWQATLQYDFFDHFGADDSDTIADTRGHGSPGQVGLWVMQRERHPLHFPFISKTTVVIDVSDAL